ncbi:MAG: hypothetical protein BMS9Abin29_0137 [Gemmatimonadota bacterium]|nr:MAG: hypothetical protein BMS9Abin29_0137 [Gemmatimonadota bacterium]
MERSDARQGSIRQVGLELVLVSFLVLVQELVLIRWLPAQVRVVAYFPNLILISAFLGLGIGALQGRRRSFLWLWPVTLLTLVSTAVLFSGIRFTAQGESEHLWLLYFDLPPDSMVIRSVRLPLILLFILSAASFVPLGQFVAARLDVFREKSSALWGYSLDLAGSLLGVIAFTLLSVSGTFPVVWFSLAITVGLVLLMLRGTRRGLSTLLILAVGILVYTSERGLMYSPYYSLDINAFEDSPDFEVTTNGSLHQWAKSLRREDPNLLQFDSIIRVGYHLPYTLLEEPPGKVLVLGAGTGNDVSVLLDEGAEEIHAVEIDPVILKIGKERHPNRPYDSPRVTVFNTDARSYLSNTNEKYDLIVFGTLDSMTRLSALSNVRLDNFVYTKDAIESARRRLAPGGGMMLYFMVKEDYIREHLVDVLSQTFGEGPLQLQGPYVLFNYVFMAGDRFDHLRPPEAAAGQTVPQLSTSIPTDDWPYLYLSKRGISGFYLSLMAAFLLIGVAGVFVSSRQMRASLLEPGGVDGEMFLYGLAFLLLETKFVTAMNLLWGATWLTSAVVFGSILVMILVGTVIMELKPMVWRVAATGLIVSLLVTYFIPNDLLLRESIAGRLAASVLFVGTPIFFASICFALRFKARPAADLAFGWNLLGAVAGGLMEFFSMLVGLKALTLVAVAAYLGSFWLYAVRDRAESEEGTPEAATATGLV